MKKGMVLTLVAAGLMLGGWTLYSFAASDVCCGKPEAACCPLK